MDPTIDAQRAWLQQLGYGQTPLLPMPSQDILDRVRGLRGVVGGNNGNPNMLPTAPIALGSGNRPGIMPGPNGLPVMSPTARQDLGFGGGDILHNISALRNRFPNTLPSPP